MLPARRGLAVWIYGGVLMGALSACFGGGDTRDPGGNAGGSGGGGGNAAFVPPCLDKADAVRNAALNPDLCTKYATVEEFEKAAIVPTKAPGCGGLICHKVGTSGTSLGLPKNEPSIRTKDAFLELAGVTNRNRGPFNYCPNDAYIDLVEPQNSYILVKVRQMKPDIACPSDGAVDPESLQMPSAGGKFDDEKLKCLEAYVIAVSEGCR